jgi:hypothetical protein
MTDDVLFLSGPLEAGLPADPVGPGPGLGIQDAAAATGARR